MSTHPDVLAGMEEAPSITSMRPFKVNAGDFVESLRSTLGVTLAPRQKAEKARWEARQGTNPLKVRAATGTSNWYKVQVTRPSWGPFFVMIDTQKTGDPQKFMRVHGDFCATSTADLCAVEGCLANVKRDLYTTINPALARTLAFFIARHELTPKDGQ